jgi:ankyrin repeat protein
MLLKAGADPTGVKGYEAFHKSPYQRGYEPSWPINQAAWGGHTAVIRLLLAAGAKVDAPEDEGQTALLIAAYRGDLDTVRLLLEAGADRSYRASAGVAGDFVGTAEEIAGKAGHSDVASYIRDFHAAK